MIELNADAPTVCALSRLAAGRDPEAWSALVERHGAAMYRAAYAVTRDEHLAADACQEAFLRIRDGAARFRPRADQAEMAARGWVVRAAVSSALMLLRTLRRRHRRERPLPAMIAAPAPVGDAQEHRDALAARLQAEIAALPERYREALLLRSHAELDDAALADVLGTSPGNARVLVHRALTRLRARLVGAGSLLSGPCLPSQPVPIPASQRWQQLLNAPSRPAAPLQPPSQGLVSLRRLAALAAVLMVVVTPVLVGFAGRHPHQRTAAQAAADPSGPGAPGPADEADTRAALARDDVLTSPGNDLTVAEFSRQFGVMHGVQMLLHSTVSRDLRTLGDIIPSPIQLPAGARDLDQFTAVLHASGYIFRIRGKAVIVGRAGDCSRYPSGTWNDAQGVEAMLMTELVALPLHRLVQRRMLSGTPTVGQWISVLNGPAPTRPPAPPAPRGPDLLSRLMPLYLARTRPLIAIDPDFAQARIPLQVLQRLVPDPHPGSSTSLPVAQWAKPGGPQQQASLAEPADTYWTALQQVAVAIQATIVIDGDQVRLVPAGSSLASPADLQLPPATRPAQAPQPVRSNG